MDKDKAFVLWFDQIGIEDVPQCGGKNASLGEMYSILTNKGVNIPNGFAITSFAYNYFIEKAGIKDKIREILSDLDTRDMHNLSEHGHKVRQLFLHAQFPEDLKEEICAQYRNLCGSYRKDKKDVDVAVRSSATAEDLPDASFAGQQETFLNIRGEAHLLDACRRCFASLFTNRAISYRVDKKFDHFKVALSIGVQKMVRSDLSCSGVMFSIDTETGFEDVAFITGSYGLGENIVQGAVNPDEYYVFKPTLKQGFKPLIMKSVGIKHIKMVYDMQGTKATTKNISVPEEDRKKFVLSDSEVLKLAEWACIIEDHYSAKAGHKKPMDMEWAKDGETNELFIVQARPETVMSQKSNTIIEEYVLHERSQVLCTGKSVGSKIASGKAHIIKDAKDIGKFKAGEILITEMTDPDWEPIMKIASAIVTNRGGRTCHSAIISRELGLPCIVGTINSTEAIKQGEAVTVCCAEGENGHVYKGALKFEVLKHDLEKIPKPKTKIMINVGNPEQAFELSFLPNDGVGLAREEFIINEYIKIHPNALLNYSKMPADVKEKIDELTVGYEDKTQFFIEKLASGVAMIAAAFYPKDVILRFSDFKSNEYRNLVGGHLFEPTEDNPMIGFRGASRYYSDKYKDGFALECQAIKKVRDEYGLTNLKVMVPFCRTVEEGRKVIEQMQKNGLKRGENSLQVYVMCEIPANVILADEFAEIFDGFSIGTNDLTQLTLGVDRDSELVAHVYDERNEAVKKMVEKVIRVARENGRKIGICGDAPSTYPEFAEFLIGCHIDSLSLSPDAVIKTFVIVSEAEKKV